MAESWLPSERLPLSLSCTSCGYTLLRSTKRNQWARPKCDPTMEGGPSILRPRSRKSQGDENNKKASECQLKPQEGSKVLQVTSGLCVLVDKSLVSPLRL